MPCTYYTPGEEAAMANAENRKLAEQVNQLTRLLCLASTVVVEQKKLKVPQYNELVDWWEAHKKHDIERIKKEALAKLTAEERKALGL